MCVDCNKVVKYVSWCHSNSCSYCSMFYYLLGTTRAVDLVHNAYEAVHKHVGR